MIFKHFFEVGEEVFVEDSILSMGGLNHGAVESSDLFGLRREIDGLSCGKLSTHTSDRADTVAYQHTSS